MILYSAVMQVLKQLHRTCPKCGHRQMVPTRLAAEEVRCNICKYAMKPPR